jgi:hypothetical protein
VREGDPLRAELFDAVAGASVHFAFERAYGESHTATGVEISDFFTDWRVAPCPESAAALRRHLPALLARWRLRVTDKASSSTFGIVLRHLGAEGAEALAEEWGHMHEDERFDLCKRLKEEDGLGPGARTRLVDALLDPSIEVRKGACEALAARGAPVKDLDPTAREDDIRPRLGPLRRWAAAP